MKRPFLQLTITSERGQITLHISLHNSGINLTRSVTLSSLPFFFENLLIKETGRDETNLALQGKKIQDIDVAMKNKI